jgi:hypothetical protein
LAGEWFTDEHRLRLRGELDFDFQELASERAWRSGEASGPGHSFDAELQAGLLSEFAYGSMEVAEGGTADHAAPSDRSGLLGLAVVEAEIADCSAGACELRHFDPIGASDGLPGLADDSLHVEHIDVTMFVEKLDQIVPMHPSVTA